MSSRWRWVFAVALAAGSVSVAATACHHDAPPPVAPADPPPLPPASGTPIGYLLDDTASLKLSDDQRTKLEAIDHGLAAELDEIDTETRAATRPPDSGQQQQPMRRGRRGGGGMSGGMGGGGRRSRGGGGGGTSGGSGAAVNYAPSAASGRATESRATDVRDAIGKAFALLDPVQRIIATKILGSHGVDVDAGRPEPGGGGDSGDEGSDAAGGSDAPVSNQP
jgi:hypothetical protein